MPVLLTTPEGSGLPRRYLIREGQRATFGSGEWVDVRFGSVPHIAKNHFTIRCDAVRAEFQVEPEAAPLLIAGEERTSGRLQQGDRIVLKDWSWTVEEAPASDPVWETRADREPALPEGPTTGDLLSGLSVGAALTALANEEPNPLTATERLIATKAYRDALTLLLAILRGNEAEEWLHGVLTDELPPETRSAAEHDLCTLWEANAASLPQAIREEISPLARTLPKTSPIHWFGMMVFWSGDSLAPPNVEPVPPPPQVAIVAGQQAFFRLSLTGPKDASNSQRHWCERGVAIVKRRSSVPIGS